MTTEEFTTAELEPHAYVQCEQIGLFAKEPCKRCGVFGCHRFEGDAIHRVEKEAVAA